MATARARPDRTPALRPPARRGAGAEPDLVESWRRQPPPIRILRTFLGVTFLYAGAQKLADPNFLHAGTLDYIGQQLKSFAEGSPIAPVLRALAHFPVLTGIGIALIEIAVGLGTVLGIAPVTVAAVGLAVNLVLFLSATWHVHPYFLGSDSMYAVAWLAYLVAVVDARRKRSGAQAEDRPSRSRKSATAVDARRRELLRGGVLAAASLFLAAASKAVAGSPSTVAPSRAATAARVAGASPASSPATAAPAAGTPIASLDSVPVGGAVGFTAPGGFPAVLLRPSQDRVVAFSRVCTHAGCLVQFDQQADALICPCHGAEFDPTRGAAVIAGPAPSPLRPIPVAIDQASGKVVATGS